MGTKWQFVYIFSNIDGSYTPIKYPPKGAEFMKQFHNYKNFYSSVLLALVDVQYRFIWESTGDISSNDLVREFRYSTYHSRGWSIPDEKMVS